MQLYILIKKLVYYKNIYFLDYFFRLHSRMRSSVDTHDLEIMANEIAPLDDLFENIALEKDVDVAIHGDPKNSY